MLEQTHKIETQIIEISLTSEKGAFELQKRISNINRNRIKPVIEKVFSRLSGPGQLHRIDKLDINIGKIDKNLSKQKFINKLEKELKRKISEAIQAKYPEGQSKRKKSKSELKEKKAKKRKAKGINKRKKTDRHLSDLQKPASRKESKREEYRVKEQAGEEKRDIDSKLLSFFLKTGFLPWWTDYNEREPVVKALERLIAEDPKVVSKILRGLFTDEHCINRAVFQFSDSILIKLADILQSQTDSETLYKEITSSGSKTRTEIWRKIFLFIAAQDKAMTGDKNIKKLKSLFAENIKKDLKIKDTKESKHRKEELLWPEIPKSGKDKFTDSESIYIKNAGIVLFETFLQNFFEELLLVNDQKFVSEKAREQAALILQYLADGLTEISEYLLPLNKILCGMKPDRPTPKYLKINNKQKRLCTVLLEKVISQSPKLEGFTVDEFRAVFLQRHGAISVRDRAWLLRVEFEGRDILLEKTPAGLIILPWMVDPLYIEWI